MKRALLLIALTSVVMTLSAQEPVTDTLKQSKAQNIEVIKQQKDSPHFFDRNVFKKGTPKFVQKLRTWFDAFAIGDQDTNYVALPEKRIILKTTFYGQNLDVRARFFIPSENEAAVPSLRYPTNLDYNVYSGANLRLALGASYRGLGGSLSMALSNRFAYSLALSSFGSTVGGEITYQTFKNVDSEIIPLYNGHKYGNNIVTEDDDVSVKYLNLNGYYCLNNKKFNYSAAYSGAAIQKKSVGTFLLGVSYSYMEIESKNGLLKSLYANDVNIYSHQASIGFGYAYNLVLLKSHLVLHASAMPQLTWNIKNRISKLSSEDFKNMYQAYTGNEISDEELAYYQQYWINPTNDKIDDYNGKHNFAPTGVVRGAATYTTGDFIFTLKGYYCFYMTSTNDDFGMASNTYGFDFILGYRL